MFHQFIEYKAEEEIFAIDNLYSSESTENSDINLSTEEEQESDI